MPYSGISVSSAGDVNGDGFADLIVGAPGVDSNGSNSGASYVLFGQMPDMAVNRTGTDASQTLAGGNFDDTLDGGGGDDKLYGNGGDDTLKGGAGIDTAVYHGARANYSLVQTGLGSFELTDLRTDSPDGTDTLIGVEMAQFSDTTIDLQQVSPKIDLSSLNGTTGFTLNAAIAMGTAGRSVASAGDVNGDGFMDVIMGGAGESYVVFGKASGFAPSINLANLNGTTGFKLSGAPVGLSVASAGDVNGDGIADLIMGAPTAGPHGTNSGATYVVFGKASGFAANIDLSSLDGTTGFKLSGVATNDLTGFSVASAGDINGDGFSDLIVGAPGVGNSSGAAYVVFGKASGFAANVDLANLDGTTGFKLSGVTSKDYSSRSVASAGDVNGDGFSDLIVGAQGADSGGNNRGAGYVIFGHASGFAANIDLSSLDGNSGFELVGVTDFDETGLSVASAGDVNHDGFADLIVGADGVDKNADNAGASYVVFGSLPNYSVSLAGTKASQTLAGGNFDDTLDGGGGNDSLYGNGGKDTLTGGAGSDRFVFDSVALADAQASTPIFDDITDYNQGNSGSYTMAEGDQLDLSALLSTAYNHGSGQTVGSLVRALNSGASTRLQIDLDGAANGANWTTIAQLDGNLTSRTVNVILDASQTTGATITVRGNAPKDLNGDGYSDIPLHNAQALAFWEMNGTSLVGGGNIGTLGAGWASAGTGDFNGDGHSDILLQNGQQLAEWQMNGTSLSGGGNIGTLGTGWAVAGISDFNGDGNSDILLQNGQQLAEWQMNGTSLTGGGNIGTLGSGWHPIQ